MSPANDIWCCVSITDQLIEVSVKSTDRPLHNVTTQIPVNVCTSCSGTSHHGPPEKREFQPYIKFHTKIILLILNQITSNFANRVWMHEAAQVTQSYEDIYKRQRTWFSIRVVFLGKYSLNSTDWWWYLKAFTFFCRMGNSQPFRIIDNIVYS